MLGRVHVDEPIYWLYPLCACFIYLDVELKIIHEMMIGKIRKGNPYN